MTPKFTHGGRRPGAGRKPTRFTVRQGQKVLIRSVFDDGVTEGRLAEVELKGKGTDRTLLFKMEDETIVVTL